MGKIKKTILGLALTVSLISCGGGGGGGSTPTGPSGDEGGGTSTGHTVSFSPTTPTAGGNYVRMEAVSTSGDTVTIAVKAASIAEPVGGMALDITYDTSKLSFISASNGDVISGSTSSFAATDSSGTVIISASDVTDASPMSNGTLFNITFKGTATGNGSIGLANGSLFNASGDSISGVNWYGGTVTVN